MKLEDNVDYLSLKTRMQSKYDDIDLIPKSVRSSIKAILEICENQEKELEEFKKGNIHQIVVCNARSYGKTKNQKDFITKEYISKDKIRETIKELLEEENHGF